MIVSPSCDKNPILTVTPEIFKQLDKAEQLVFRVMEKDGRAVIVSDAPAEVRHV